MAHTTQHKNACVKLPFCEKTRLRRVLWRLLYFHNETRSGGYLGHGCEGIGNRDREEKGIVACCPLAAAHCRGTTAGGGAPRQWCPSSGQRAAGLRWETIVATIPFSSIACFSLYFSLNQTQSFEIHIIIRRRTQLLAVMIYVLLYRYLYIIWYCLDIELQDSRRSTRSVQCITVPTSAWYRGRKLLRATPAPSTLTRL